MRWAGAFLVLIGVQLVADKQLLVAVMFFGLPGFVALMVWRLMRRQERKMDVYG